MKIYQPYLILGVILLAILWPVKEEETDTMVFSRPPYFSTSEYIDRFRKRKDTMIDLSIYDFSKLAADVSMKVKKREVKKAIIENFPQTSYRYLGNEYWKRDSAHKDFASVYCPSCQFSDFYFIDLDKDGDLDIIYSSLLNDYLNDDSNQMLLFRNNKGKYEVNGINGFAYEVNVKNLSKGKIIFHMASLGCCDDQNYHFHIDTFNVYSWHNTSKHIIDIRTNQVNLHYQTKEIL